MNMMANQTTNLAGTQETGYAEDLRESSLGINAAGHLMIEDLDAVSLVEKFGSPVWVVSESTIRRNYRNLRNALTKKYDKVVLAYGSKANHSPSILALLTQEGASIDCVSLTQLELAKSAGVSPSNIVFNGSNKSQQELEIALERGIGLINVDSIDELNFLREICRRLGKQARINLRIRASFSAIEDRDPDFAKNYTAENKFGLDVESGQALEAFSLALGMPEISLKGVSHHIGWTAYGTPHNKDLELLRQRAGITEALEFVVSLKEKLNFIPEVMDFGGGFRKRKAHGFGPRGNAEIPSLEEYSENISKSLFDSPHFRKLNQPTVIFEPGGYLTTDAATLLSTVGTIKEVSSGKGKGKWVGVDASSYFFVRKLIYGMYHHTIIANRANEAPEEVVDIVGNTCTYDYIADKVRVPKLKRGDIVATLDQGSYCETISTQYCGFPRPATVLVNGADATVIRKREVPENIVEQFVVPERLRARSTVQ